MKEKEIKKLLNKFKAGQCSPEELEMLQTLMEGFDQQNTTYHQQNADLKQILWERIAQKTTNEKPVIQLNPQWLKIAAVLLIALFTVFFGARMFRKQNADNTIAYQVITAPAGQIKQIILPDSTIVHLNAASSIRFPVQFSDKKREVSLLDGEAFFEVKHDALKPFLVHTAQVTTQVLGTSFNIKFYRELPDIQVFVNTGKVEIHHGKQTMGMYMPGQQLTYNKQTGIFQKQLMGNDNSLSWMRDELVLNDVSFKEVAVYLHNRYQVNFRDARFKPNRHRYSVRFSNKLAISQVTDILQLLDGRDYKLEGNTITIK